MTAEPMTAETPLSPSWKALAEEFGVPYLLVFPGPSGNPVSALPETQRLHAQATILVSRMEAALLLIERTLKMAENVTSQLSDLADAYEGIFTQAQTLISDAQTYYNDHDQTVADLQAKYEGDEATLAGLQPFLDRLTASKNGLATALTSALQVVAPPTAPETGTEPVDTTDTTDTTAPAAPTTDGTTPPVTTATTPAGDNSAVNG